VLVSSRRWLLVLCAALVSFAGAVAEERGARMGIFTKPGARLDLTRTFTDSEGKTSSLSMLALPGRPFILVPVFYRCPRLCGMTIAGVVDLVNRLQPALGSDYSVILYSFNPDDTTRDAAEKRAKMVVRIGEQPVTAREVSFLTAKRAVIDAINDELGFRVRFADKELEHSSAIFIVDPDGVVVRYFAGVEFDPAKVTAALRDGTPSGR